ncbi:ABC transporter permease [Novosphingobium pentaromativorans US6-1]|uniref:ABC transmembrane type-1 domain-containing protein n=2 Tax=Novosphingobium pentaromativorans TaxID=205844 RepID=G6EA82_9SPHN|nr:ABC transporter permease [Novosphingobium pentaromativorans US6-1]EHJ61797.1 hypothetical protein NSU_1253 [Novosphingobium pentaromativorans US6-1]
MAGRFAVRHLWFLLQTVFWVVTLVFFLTKLIPGDPARVAAGRFATPDQVEHMRTVLHLDQPVVMQYAGFLGQMVRGDLGRSTTTHQPILSDLATRLPMTLQVVAIGMAMTALVGIGLGTIAASARQKKGDLTVRILLALAGGIPIFWAAIILQWWLGHRLQLFPISGATSYALAMPARTGATVIDAALAGNGEAVWDAFIHLLLPAICLSLPFIAVVGRNVRSSMIGALSSDYVLFSIACGAGPVRVAFHALRATIAPTLTILGMQCGWMTSASLLIETTFGIPGIGAYLAAAAVNQDIFAVLGCVLVIGTVFACANLIVDLLQIWLDPRLRSTAASQGA